MITQKWFASESQYQELRVAYNQVCGTASIDTIDWKIERVSALVVHYGRDERLPGAVPIAVIANKWRPVRTGKD